MAEKQPTPIQPSMLTKEGKVDPKLAAQEAERRIRAQMEATKQKNLENARNLKEAEEAAKDRGDQHSP